MKTFPLERVLVIAALLVFGGGTFSLGYLFHEKFTGDREEKAPCLIYHYPSSELRDGKLPVEPATWLPPQGQHPLFASFPSFLLTAGGDWVDLREDRFILSGQVTLGWAKEWRLSLADAQLAWRDEDGDGFFNDDEFLGGTNPHDRHSHPAFLSKLRVEEETKTRIPIEFGSHAILQGRPQFFVKMSLPTHPAQKDLRLSMGDLIPGTPWKVVDFKQKDVLEWNKATNQENRVDRSVITLEHQKLGTFQRLTRGKKGHLEEMSVDFSVILPGHSGQTIKVVAGEQFSLAQEPESRYQLMMASNQGAVIREVGSNKMLTIKQVTPLERERLAGLEDRSNSQIQ